MALTLSRSKRASWLPKDGFQAVTAGVSLLVPGTLIVVVVILILEGSVAIHKLGFGFLFDPTWKADATPPEYGALGFILGTLYASGMAMAMAVPIGIAVAIFLAEPTAARARTLIGSGVELLAAIPSVVFGIWGIFVLAPFVDDHLEQPLHDHFPSFPILFAPSAIPRSTVLTTSFVLAIMILPTIAAVSRDVIRAVPGGLKESSVALGATWWETIWRVILPAARPGIIGATVLALGRAIGETVAVAMTIGNGPISASLVQPGSTLASEIFNAFNEATGAEQGVLISLALVLMVLALAVNVVAVLLVRATAGFSRVVASGGPKPQ